MKTRIFSSRSWYLVLSFLSLAGALPALAQDSNLFTTVIIQAIDPVAREGGWDGTGRFVVRRTGPTNFPLAVFYQLSGSASNGVDYEQLGTSVHIPVGELVASITVKPIDDSEIEGTETVLARLVGSPLDCATCAYNIGEPNAAGISLMDNDFSGTNHPPFVQLNEPQDGEVFAAPADIVLRAFVQDAEDGYELKVEFFEGTNGLGFGTFVPALCPAPYCPFYQLIWSNVPPGSYELRAAATDANGATTVSPPVRVGVIDSNIIQTVVNIYATDPTGSEIPVVPPWLGMPQASDPIVFTVTRSGPTSFPLTVFYSVGGTASDGIDYFYGSAGFYDNLPGRVAIPAGAFSANILVGVMDDLFVEGTETVELTVQPPACIQVFPPPPDCYLVGPSNHAVAHIVDDDLTPAPVVRIVATDPDASESGPDTGTFTVSRTGDTSDSLPVFYTIGGTARMGVDYFTSSNFEPFFNAFGLTNVVIPAGASSADIKVTPIDDNLAEGSETVRLQLQQPDWVRYLVGAPSNAVVTIADNDVVGTNHPPFVQLNSPQNGEVFIAPATIALRAYAQDDEDGYHLKVEFFEGTHSLGLGTFVPALCPAPHCPFYELPWSNVPAGNYTLTAKATDSSGVSSVSGPIHVTVIDGVSIYATDPVATEHPAISTIPPDTATFTVRRSGETNIGIVVYYEIGGTASDGVDYRKLSGQVTIPEGAFSAEIVVDPIDDNLVEGTEGVILTLIPPCPPCLFANPPCEVPQGTNCYPIGVDNRAGAIIRDNDATNLPPMVRMISPQNGQVFTVPVNITLMANADDREDFELQVEFFEGTNSLGLGNFLPGLCPICPFYWLTWSNVPPGQYTLTAKATDSAGASSVSEPVNISVLPLPGTKLWELDRGIVYASAAVGGDGTVYVPAGNAIVNLYALTPGGDTKWAQVLAGGGSSPSIADDGTIYVARFDGQNTFRAYNPDGTLRWSIPLNVASTFLGASSSAIARDGTIYIGGEGSLDKGLHALRPDGTLKWKFVPVGDLVYTPVVGTDGTIYFGVANDGLYAVNPDGTRRWNLPMAGHHIWAAVGGDGTIYVVGSISPTKLFAFAPDGMKKWERQIGPETSQYSSAPIVGPGGTIFVVSDKLYAFNSDGSGKWSFAPPASLGHSAVSPAVDSQGNVYAGLGESFVAVSPSGSLLWSFATGDTTFTAPTLTPDGIVYVGSGDIFYAFQANAGLAESPWPMFQRDIRHTGAAPLTSLLPVVNIVARDPFASEGAHFWRDYPDANTAGIWDFWHVNVGGTNTATFVVRRHGPIDADRTIHYEIGGTASNGVDYALLSGSVAIPAGRHSARIVVVPIDDTLAEGIETVALKLKPAPDYIVGSLSHASAIIIDNELPRPRCVMLSDRQFHLCRPATNGFCFRIEASTDLRNWVPICTNIVTDGALHFVDPDAPSLDARFYRVAYESGLPPDD